MTTSPLRLLTVPQAAARLGVKRDVVYQLVHRKELRFVDVAATGAQSRLRIREDDLVAFMERRTATTDTPTTGDALAAST